MANPYTRIGYSSSDGTDGSTTLPPDVSYGTKSTGKTKRRNPYTSYGYTDENPTSFADQLQETIASSKPTPANTDSNLQKIGHVGAGVGRFIKNVAKDVKDTTVGTYQGLGDVARGELGRQGVGRTTKIIEQRNKQWREQFGSASDSQWQDPAFQAKAKEFSAGTKALINATNKYNERSNADIATSGKVNTKKLAFQAGETALNVGTLGVGGLVTAPIKAGLKLGARKVAKDVTQSLSKKVLTTAGKDSALGVGYGITQTGKNNPDATAGEFVKGGVIGGVAGRVFRSAPLAGIVAPRIPPPTSRYFMFAPSWTSST